MQAIHVYFLYTKVTLINMFYSDYVYKCKLERDHLHAETTPSHFCFIFVKYKFPKYKNQKTKLSRSIFEMFHRNVPPFIFYLDTGIHWK